MNALQENFLKKLEFHGSMEFFFQKSRASLSLREHLEMSCTGGLFTFSGAFL